MIFHLCGQVEVRPEVCWWARILSGCSAMGNLCMYMYICAYINLYLYVYNENLVFELMLREKFMPGPDTRLHGKVTAMFT